MQLILPVLFLLLAPVAVTACEGDCIVDITNEYLNRYENILLTALQKQADQISEKLVPAPSRRENSIVYFAPVLKAYNSTAYNSLEKAIFPGYFHGKCQDANGVNPPGCPNPDCPKVCGTPGSMVHFFSTLTEIVYNETTDMLTSFTAPGSKPYNQIQQMVIADVNKGQMKRMENLSRIMPLRSRAAIQGRTTHSIQQGLKKIMKELRPTMLETCGGSNLSLCSWEQPMKEFILQYP
ncbi:hypothetical protein DEU56DRAFT_808799 [Suillus clintonianus]|uniref:uncharacterized protein n=1 Tax=Suillus clintonianus TaxID=1904413 RepID=UPI001B85CE40|nr:uncharacterized protein DEU56DRAFT_808799 [Suillus clintonianus]KAG2134820.1 hypothetical protein DEU56DRAFT_808799 [Suillus clintonianus]